MTELSRLAIRYGYAPFMILGLNSAAYFVVANHHSYAWLILLLAAAFAIAHMAEHFHVQMGHHEEAQVALHLLAAIPHSLYVEIFPNPKRDPMWAELPAAPLRIRGGFMELPEAPGLGMELNEDVIARYRAG